MNEEQGFIATILANPEEETARLAYADWLDDHGDPRAEWLRVEAEIERLARLGRRAVALLDRRQELAAEFDLAWLAAVGRRVTSREFDSADDAWDWLGLRLRTTPGHLPQPEDFDRFETDYGVRLPGGYRSFASRFGAGHLGAWFRIAVPGNPAGSPWYDLDALNRHSVRDTPPGWIEEIHCPHDIPANEVAAQIRRLVFFCSLEAEEYVGWDPEDVRDSDTPEYGVYVLPRLGPPVECAYSFEQFVFDICLGDRGPKFFNGDPREWRESEYRVEGLWMY